MVQILQRLVQKVLKKCGQDGESISVKLQYWILWWIIRKKSSNFSWFIIWHFMTLTWARKALVGLPWEALCLPFWTVRRRIFALWMAKWLSLFEKWPINWSYVGKTGSINSVSFWHCLVIDLSMTCEFLTWNCCGATNYPTHTGGRYFWLSSPFVSVCVWAITQSGPILVRDFQF